MTVKGQFGGLRIAQAVKATRLTQLGSLPKIGFVQILSAVCIAGVRLGKHWQPIIGHESLSGCNHRRRLWRSGAFERTSIKSSNFEDTGMMDQFAHGAGRTMPEV